MTAHRFCAVLAHRGRLFIAKEAKAGGPRVMILPPKELPPGMTVTELAPMLQSALAAYADLDRSLAPAEWDARNGELLSYFGEASVPAFERRKREITLRHDKETGEIMLFGSGAGLNDWTKSVADIEAAAEVVLDRLKG